MLDNLNNIFKPKINDGKTFSLDLPLINYKITNTNNQNKNFSYNTPSEDINSKNISNKNVSKPYKKPTGRIKKD